MLLTFDAETTTKLKGNPHVRENQMVSYAYRSDRGDIGYLRYDDPDFLSCIRSLIRQCSCFVGFNAKFDLHWLLRYDINLPVGCKVFDCSLAEYILTGQQAGMISLNKCLEEYGFETKLDEVAEQWKLGIDTPDIDPDLLREYNIHDVRQTYQLYQAQLSILSDKQLHLLYQMGEDLIYLMQAEKAGVKFDVENANAEILKLDARLAELEGTISYFLPVLPDGCTFNYDSGDQLSCLLYGGLLKYEYATSETAVYKSGEKKGQQYERNRWHSEDVTFKRLFNPLKDSEVAKTKADPNATTRFYQTDSPTLKQLRPLQRSGATLLTALQKRSELIKVKEMIQTMLDKQIDGYIHGQFNQNIARTGRLSSSNPNMQNTPPEVDALLVSRYND